MTLIEVIKTFRRQIFIIAGFILLENISWIIEPTLFGNLLDALIDRFYDKENYIDYFTPLLIWIGIYLLNLAGGVLSRISSGSIYPKIYMEIALRIIANCRKSNMSASVTLARVELAKDYITFLKERLPEITWQFSATFGATTALFFYDWRIAIVCLLVIIPMTIINKLYNRNVISLQKEINDRKEDIYHVINEKDIPVIKSFYFKNIKPQRKIAIWNSVNYGVIRFILLFIFMVVLFLCVDVDKFSTGNIYSVVAYLWTFISSTEYMPVLLESIISVKELSNRFKLEVTEEPV